MSFPKLALSLSIAGLLAGFTLSFLVTPRYTATAVVALRDQNSDPQTPEIHREMVETLADSIAKVRSIQEISTMIQDPRLDLYKEERARMPIERVIDKAREAMQISVVDGNGGQSFSALRITFTYRDGPQAAAFLNAVISRLVAGHQDRLRILLIAQSAERDRDLQTHLAELQARLAVLESRLGVPAQKPPVTPPPPVTTVTPNANPFQTYPGLGPVFSQPRHIRYPVTLEALDLPVFKKEYPNPLAFTLTGGILGFLLAIPLSRRQRYH